MLLDIIFGMAIGGASVFAAVVYLNHIHKHLMNPAQTMKDVLEVSILYRLFVVAFAIVGTIGSAAIVSQTAVLSRPEALMGWAITLVFVVLLCLFVYYTFFVRAVVTDQYIETQSIFGNKRVNLNQLTSFKIKNEFSTLQLKDGVNVINFCHQVEGKRALFEHLLRYVPEESKEQLHYLLDMYE